SISPPQTVAAVDRDHDVADALHVEQLARTLFEAGTADLVADGRSEQRAEDEGEEDDDPHPHSPMLVAGWRGGRSGGQQSSQTGMSKTGTARRRALPHEAQAALGASGVGSVRSAKAASELPRRGAAAADAMGEINPIARSRPHPGG